MSSHCSKSSNERGPLRVALPNTRCHRSRCAAGHGRQYMLLPLNCMGHIRILGVAFQDTGRDPLRPGTTWDRPKAAKATDAPDKFGESFIFYGCKSCNRCKHFMKRAWRSAIEPRRGPDGRGMLGDRSRLLNSGFEVSAVQQSIS